MKVINNFEDDSDLSESEIDPWDPQLIRLDNNSDSPFDAEYLELSKSESDSDAEIVGTQNLWRSTLRTENPERLPDDNEDFELITFESNLEIKEKGAESTDLFNPSLKNSESLMEDNEDFVLVSPQSNPEIEAKNPVYNSRFIQNFKSPLENINLLLMMQAFSLAIRIYSSARSRQQRLPLSIEYKRNENPEIPRFSLPILNELFLSTLGYYNSCQTMTSALTLNREFNSLSFMPSNIMSPVLPNSIILPLHERHFPPVEDITPEPEESLYVLSGFDLIKHSLINLIDSYDSQTLTAREAISRGVKIVILLLSMPADTFLAPRPSEFFLRSTYPTMPVIENPHLIGSAAEDHDESHPETNPEEPVVSNASAPARQDPESVVERSAGLHRFGITACLVTANCLRRFFGSAQSPGFGS